MTRIAAGARRLAGLAGLLLAAALLIAALVPVPGTDPWPARHAAWLAGALHGDLGRSADGQPVAALLAAALPASLERIGAALLLAMALGTTAGLLLHAVRDDALRGFGETALALLMAVPSFLLVLLLLVPPLLALPLLPPAGRLAPALAWTSRTGALSLDALLAADLAAFASLLWHLLPVVLPVAVAFAAPLAAALLAALRAGAEAPHVVQARLSGLAPARVLRRHVFPAAAREAYGLAASRFGMLVAAVLAAEALAGQDGLGPLLLAALREGDAATIRATALASCLPVGAGAALVRAVARPAAVG